MSFICMTGEAPGCTKSGLGRSIGKDICFDVSKAIKLLIDSFVRFGMSDDGVATLESSVAVGIEDGNGNSAPEGGGRVASLLDTLLLGWRFTTLWI